MSILKPDSLALKVAPCLQWETESQDRNTELVFHSELMEAKQRII